MPSIEDHIRKAMEEGLFDNLPGKGKPLHLDQDANEDPEWRMAYHVLKNAGYTLPWIEARQEILTTLDKHRLELKRVWSWRARALEAGEAHTVVEQEWKRALKVFKEGLEALNVKIRSYNIEAPGDRFHLNHLNIDKEVEAITKEV